MQGGLVQLEDNARPDVLAQGLVGVELRPDGRIPGLTPRILPHPVVVQPLELVDNNVPVVVGLAQQQRVVVALPDRGDPRGPLVRRQPVVPLDVHRLQGRKVDYRKRAVVEPHAGSGVHADDVPLVFDRRRQLPLRGVEPHGGNVVEVRWHEVRRLPGEERIVKAARVLPLELVQPQGGDHAAAPKQLGIVQTVVARQVLLLFAPLEAFG